MSRSSCSCRLVSAMPVPCGASARRDADRADAGVGCAQLGVTLRESAPVSGAIGTEESTPRANGATHRTRHARLGPPCARAPGFVESRVPQGPRCVACAGGRPPAPPGRPRSMRGYCTQYVAELELLADHEMVVCPATCIGTADPVTESRDRAGHASTRILLAPPTWTKLRLRRAIAASVLGAGAVAPRFQAALAVWRVTRACPTLRRE